MSSVLVVIEPHLHAYRPKSFLGSHFFIINFRFKPFETISYLDGISDDSSIFYYFKIILILYRLNFILFLYNYFIVIIPETFS